VHQKNREKRLNKKHRHETSLLVDSLLLKVMLELVDLPTDLLVIIFGHVNLYDYLHGLMPSCKTVKAICDDDVTWRYLWVSHFRTVDDMPETNVRMAFRSVYCCPAIYSQLGVWSIIRHTRSCCVTCHNGGESVHVVLNEDFCALVTSSSAVLRHIRSDHCEYMPVGGFFAEFAEDLAGLMRRRTQFPPLAPFREDRVVSGFSVSLSCLTVPGHRQQDVLIIRHPRLPFMFVVPSSSAGWVDVWAADTDLTAEQLPEDCHVWPRQQISSAVIAHFRQPMTSDADELEVDS
jgi:hypothetical protein